MEKTAKIFIAGRFGLVGSAIERALRKNGYEAIVGLSHAEIDYTVQAEVETYFKIEKPDYVFLAAAKVGGILANNTYPADFIFSNLEIQNNVIHASYEFGVKKLMFLGSSCIYPKFAQQPMHEDELLNGKLEPTNEPYAVAKIAGITMCTSYNRQYGTNFISVMPTNLYGINDNYHPENSHVIPGLLRRFHEAKVTNAPEVVVWGTGSPKREFLFADDLGDACVFVMQHYSANEIINIGTGVEVTIKELAELIKKTVDYQGKLRFDDTKPDGTPRKLLDVSRLHRLGWRHRTELEDGLKVAYKDFLEKTA
ncbi:GDP-fucose synthetase [candidate division KSB3 bacterium]|uniref:GDP-L-fucose synthase n=1 Tax=candidate division KSB3 bacterium TaxID=2044937 RepID=A0A2G6KG50_9BACT|nr:MAG: GDP-fucose synthetase [candidate division KSB3 bacterium]